MESVFFHQIDLCVSLLCFQCNQIKITVSDCKSTDLSCLKCPKKAISKSSIGKSFDGKIDGIRLDSKYIINSNLLNLLDFVENLSRRSIELKTKIAYWLQLKKTPFIIGCLRQKKKKRHNVFVTALRKMITAQKRRKTIRNFQEQCK